MFFAAGERISMEILVGLGLHSRCPVALKRFVAFSKNGNVQEKYLSSLLSGHPTVAEYIESSASELSEENVISKDQNWWEPPGAGRERTKKFNPHMSLVCWRARSYKEKCDCVSLSRNFPFVPTDDR